MMEQSARMECWSEKWTKGSLGFHKTDVNSALVDHGKKLLPGPYHRIFVPLCGKSVDLKWFYDGGHSVVGVEGIEQAIVEFFTEHNITHTTQTLPWGKLFKSSDERLCLYCCDLLTMDVETLGKFDAVWDRASLVAIYEEDRESYVKLLKSLLRPDFRYLLVIVQYSSQTFSGPPRNVPTDLVEKFYGETCRVEELGTEVLPQDEWLTMWNIKTMTQVVLLLTPKSVSQP